MKTAKTVFIIVFMILLFAAEILVVISCFTSSRWNPLVLGSIAYVIGAVLFFLVGLLTGKGGRIILLKNALIWPIFLLLLVLFFTCLVVLYGVVGFSDFLKGVK